VRGQKDQAEASFQKAVDVRRSRFRRGSRSPTSSGERRAADAEQTLKDALALDPENLTANSARHFYMASNRARSRAVLRAIARTANTTPAILVWPTTMRHEADPRRRRVSAISSPRTRRLRCRVMRLSLGCERSQRAQPRPAEPTCSARSRRHVGATAPGARALRGRQERRRVEGGTSIVTDEPTSTAAAPAYVLIGQIQVSTIGQRMHCGYQEAVKRQSQPVAAEAALAGISLRKGPTTRQRRRAAGAGDPAAKPNAQGVTRPVSSPGQDGAGERRDRGARDAVPEFADPARPPGPSN